MEIEMKWMDQINEVMKNNGPTIDDETQQWKKHSIYKVPSQVKDLNKKAYKPQVISFGPYHYGEENLKPMEEHKHRALIHFLKRYEKPIELIFEKMEQVVQELRDSYKPLDSIWTLDTSNFVQMMILDGCFILEILRDNDSYLVNDYAENDPIFGKHGKHYLMSYIMRDMLMLENQIPMIVLHTLKEIVIDTEEEDCHDLLNRQIIEFLNPNIPLKQRLGKCMHVLDVYRKSLIQDEPRRRTCKSTKKWLCIEEGEEDHIIRSAIELNDVGITFKKSKTRSLKDVTFKGGVLWLPTLELDDNSEYIFLNLIAFERLHEEAGYEITSFIFFMDTIIDNALDVPFLSRKHILINALGSDKVVAKLFNSLSREIPLDRHGPLDEVRLCMNAYCRKPWKSWRASLIHTYFRNPWAMVSLIAAIFLFSLTIIQTIYTVRQFYQNPNPNPSPTMSPILQVPRSPHRP